MNVAVVNLGKQKATHQLADDIARTAKTHTLEQQEFDYQTHIDLLIIAFDCHLIAHTKQIQTFINNLNQQYIKNVTLVSIYTIKNPLIKQVRQLCTNNNLPLMREQLICKVPLKTKKVSDSQLMKARYFTEDMITIINNYY